MLLPSNTLISQAFIAHFLKRFFLKQQILQARHTLLTWETCYKNTDSHIPSVENVWGEAQNCIFLKAPYMFFICN